MSPSALQHGVPQDDLPQPSLKDFPALALHASVIAVRRPASLLLPATATLFCARCVARVAEIALRLSESDRLNAWAGARSGSCSGSRAGLDACLCLLSTIRLLADSLELNTNTVNGTHHGCCACVVCCSFTVAHCVCGLTSDQPFAQQNVQLVTACCAKRGPSCAETANRVVSQVDVFASRGSTAAAIVLVCVSSSYRSEHRPLTMLPAK